MGDLRHACGDNYESLSLYIKSFKDRPEEELLEKITHLSNELGLWKDVKTSFMAEEGDTHNLLELYLRDKDLPSAFKIASQHIDDIYDTERFAKTCEKSMPYEAAELYRNMAEESIKQSNRNAYRTAKYYFKAMYRLYTSLKKEKNVTCRNLDLSCCYSLHLVDYFLETTSCTQCKSCFPVSNTQVYVFTVTCVDCQKLDLVWTLQSHKV
jgi:hypothetical protein